MIYVSAVKHRTGACRCYFFCIAVYVHRKRQKKNSKKGKEKDGDEEHSDSESDESRNDSKTEKVACLLAYLLCNFLFGSCL